MRREGGAVLAKRSSIIRHTALLIGVFGLVGCAHQPPPVPQELTDARAAYQRAIRGPALGTDPIRLGMARYALDEAETGYRSGAKPEDVRDRAYVSLRLTQIAEAEAAAQMLAARRQRAVGELATLEARQRADQAARDQAARAERERLAREAAANTAAVNLPAKVNFAFDEASLEPEATKVLEQEAEVLKDLPASAGKVVVEGHTDSVGDPAYNQDLAERRAETVRDYLISHGVEGATVKIESAGSDLPVADNATAEGRAKNRRVEIQVEPAPKPAPVATPPATPAPRPTTTPPMNPPRSPLDIEEPGP
jgi:outer membrane protein OmpA-like peptidoglycan-associated protein